MTTVSPSGVARDWQDGEGLREDVGVDDDRVARPCRVPARWASVIASAAAVLSSSSDALATGSAVSSSTMVWKLSSASSRPWLISGWYGV